MKKVEKGEFGYLAYKKSRNMIKTIIAFAIVLVIFIIGFIIWKSKNNYLTMLAVVLVLPAAKFAVSYFVLIPHKNCDEELKNAIEKCKGELNSVYDLVVSNKQKPVGIMAAVISDNQILAYTSSAKADKNLFETSVKEFLKNEKLTCSVLLYKDKDTYLGKIKNTALNFDESKENSLDLYGVKVAFLGFLIDIDGGRIQKGERLLHLGDMCAVFFGDFVRKFCAIECRRYHSVVVLGCTVTEAAQERRQYDKWRQDQGQHLTGCPAPILIGQHGCRHAK